MWNRLFLEERPSISLSFFRMAVAFTVASHVIPSFCHMQDNYLSTAYRELNGNFFTKDFLLWVSQSPPWLIYAMVGVFLIANFTFLVGFLSQVSCIVLTAACYYFYALNSFHVGTLSWDILLVTMFLMCLTPYHGDYFSVDSLLWGSEDAYKRRRPFVIQRMLQMQVGFTFFYTALVKIVAGGNWLQGNSIYYLMHASPWGTTKWFLLRDFLANHPQLCYYLGIFLITVEISMVFLLAFPATRVSAIYLGCIFHVMLILTLDVPATFFFLFPPQLFLFINPNRIVEWIEKKREDRRGRLRPKLVYDGHCQFCLNSVRMLKVMDLWSAVEYIDLHSVDLALLHSGLTKEKAMSQLHLIDTDQKLFGGFSVLQQLSFKMPMLYPWIFVFYFPGMGIVGPILYKFIAKNRYLFHFRPACKNNACYR